MEWNGNEPSPIMGHYTLIEKNILILNFEICVSKEGMKEMIEVFCYPTLRLGND